MTLSIFSSRFCLTVFGILGFTLSSQAAETPQASQLLWYNAPAKKLAGGLPADR